MRERNRLDGTIDGFRRLQRDLEDNLELIELGEAEADAAVVAEAEKALGVAVQSADPEIAAEALFSRADLLARRKDPRAGAEFLKLTYRYPDRRMWAARALGRAGALYESAGRRATARRIVQKMRKVAPPGAWRAKAEATLRRLGKAPGPRR